MGIFGKGNASFFLDEDDFNFYKNLMPAFFENVQLKALKNDSAILGFIGTDKENLEMLFVGAHQRGKGIGRQLIHYALENLHITKVDVNQQNLQALEFYKHFGFESKSISKVDGFGKPYPIVHMELRNSPL